MHLSNDSSVADTAAYENEYSLSIRINSDGFSLSVHDEMGAVLLSQAIEEELSLLNSSDVISLFEENKEIVFSDYNEISITVEGDTYLFVPEQIFNPRQIDDYFQFQFQRRKEEFVLFNRIESWACVAVFSISFALSKALSTVFPETPITHHITKFLSETIQTTEDSLHVMQRSKMIDVVALKKGVPYLVSSFSYQTEEDLAYYALRVFEQSEFDTEKHKLFLYQKERDLRIENLLLNYVKNCSFSLPA